MVLFSFFSPDYIQQEAKCTTGRRWVREMTLLYLISMIPEEEGEEVRMVNEDIELGVQIHADSLTQA